MTGQFENDRLTDPAVAAGDNGNLALQRHDQPLNMMRNCSALQPGHQWAERVSVGWRCALALEVSQRHQRLGAHARVIVDKPAFAHKER